MNKVKIPYCESDFRDLVEHGYIYIDKTDYIEELEKIKKCYMYTQEDLVKVYLQV